MLYVIEKYDICNVGDTPRPYIFSYLGYGNPCSPDPVARYSLYRSGAKVVYFKEKWQAHMYISRFCALNDASEYRVKAVESPADDSPEIFDPALFEFVKPDEYTAGKDRFIYRAKDLLEHVDFLICRYNSFKDECEKLTGKLKSLSRERPDMFKGMWNRHIKYDSMIESKIRKKLFDDVYKMMDSENEDHAKTT